MGIFDKISKFFENLSEERNKQWWAKQEEKEKQEAIQRELDKEKVEYYNAFLHNFLLDSMNEFSHVSRDSYQCEYDDKFKKEYEKAYSNMSLYKVDVPSVPNGAFDMKELEKLAEKEDDCYTHTEWNYDYCYNSVEYDKGRPYYSSKHIFVNMMLFRSKYKEIQRLMNKENYNALWELNSVLTSQLYEEQREMEE